LPPIGLADDEAGGFEGLEGVSDGLFSGAYGGSELFEALGALVEGGEEALLEGGIRGRLGVCVTDVET
jgi:hypothetical protein